MVLLEVAYWGAYGSENDEGEPPMIITIKKLSGQQHELEIYRTDGTSDRQISDTRNFLKHDLIHYAVESEASLQGGFWGLLAAGKSFRDLNDRTGESIRELSQDIMTIEAVVGVLHNIDKINSIHEFLDTLRSQGEGLGWSMPDWFDHELIARVRERLRQINGHWNATQFGGSMKLTWK